MASSNAKTSEAGFATTAAVVVSLGLSMIAAATVALSVQELRAARADASRAQADYKLQGLATEAGLAAMARSSDTRAVLSVASPFGAATVIVEPEATKAGPSTVDNLNDARLKVMGVVDPDALRGRLSHLDAANGGDIALQDGAPLWRACGPSVFSLWGAGTAFAPGPTTGTPATAPSDAGHIGQVWSLRVASQGWEDDRIVRFTGSGHHPVDVIERRFGRAAKGDTACEQVIAAVLHA